MRRCLGPIVVAGCLVASGCIEGKTRPTDAAFDQAPRDGDLGSRDGDLGGDLGAPGTWVTVPPGTFLMGPRPGNPCDDTRPQRKVTLTRAFQLAATEVTRGGFEAVMGWYPDSIGPKCDTCPAGVRWHAAAAHCNGLSEQAGLPRCYQCAGEEDTLTCVLDPKYAPAAQQTVYDCPGYRLPTEAEWEYAYRAGTQTDLHSGNITETGCTIPDAAANLIAWYCRFGGEYSNPVGGKLPNSWGLYDMAGNYQEWCDDGYQTDLGSSDANDPWIPGPTTDGHAQRGGTYAEAACQVRAVARRARMPYEYGGFRCARSLP